MNISMQLVYQYMAIFFNYVPTSNHLHPLQVQVQNCDSNSRLVVDEDENGKFRLERVKQPSPRRAAYCILHGPPPPPSPPQLFVFKIANVTIIIY